MATKTIGYDNSGVAGDYTSFAAWVTYLTGLGAMSGPETGLYMWGTSTPGTAFATGVDFTGVTNGANLITLDAQTGYGFKSATGAATNPLRIDASKGGAIVSSAYSGKGINCPINNVTVRGLQVKMTGTFSKAFSTSSSTGLTIESCVLESTPASSGAVVTLYDATDRIVNSVVVNAGTVGDGLFAGAAIVQDTAVIRPSSITAAGNGLKTAYASNAPKVQGTAFFGFTTAVAVATNFASGSGNNATDLGSFTPGTAGTGNLFSQTGSACFTNAGTAGSTSLDLRPKAGSPLINAGVAITSPATISADIIGTTRPQGTTPDIGPWEVAAASSSFTVTPSTLPANHLGNLTVDLVGTGTSWTGSTTWAASGVSGWSVASKSFTDSTHYSVTLTPPTSATPPAGATGTLTLAEGVTGTTTGTAAVAAPALVASPTSGTTGTTPTLTLTGANTLWTTETAAGLFTVSGGTGASVATPAVTTNTAATAVLTVGTAAGTLTLADHSTGATATFTANAPSPVTAGTLSLTNCTKTSITLGWTAATNGSGTKTYQVQRATRAGGTYVSIGSPTTGTTYTDSGLTFRRTYWYQVVVTDTSGSATYAYLPAATLPKRKLWLGFLGDSVTAQVESNGGSAVIGTNVTDSAADLFATTVTDNRGVGGTTTDDWLPTAAARAVTWQGVSQGTVVPLTWAKAAFATSSAASGVTDIYIHVMLGTNDAGASTTAATYGANLAAVCANLVAAGYKVILSYPPWANANSSAAVNDRLLDYQARVDALVDGVTVFRGDTDVYSAFADNPTNLTTNDVHPTAAGRLTLQKLWSDAITNVLFSEGRAAAAHPVRFRRGSN
jgi:lysophospholipase L1-like esterase